MVVGHVEWGTQLFGAKNCHDGEYDTYLCYWVVLGVPVYLSFRQCVHVIEHQALKRHERAEQIVRFAREHLNQGDIRGYVPVSGIVIPLKPSWSSKVRVLHLGTLWAGFTLAVCAVVASFALMQAARAIKADDVNMLIVLWAGFAYFAVGLPIYLLTRKPTKRQAGIRAVVANVLGPYSDVADWDAPLIRRVATSFGLADPQAERLLEAAERSFAANDYETALLCSRMALGLMDPSEKRQWADRAEAITDDALEKLSEKESRQ
jgi:hypothetical protein